MRVVAKSANAKADTFDAGEPVVEKEQIMNTRKRSPKVVALNCILTPARSFGLRLRAKNRLRPAFAAAALLTLLSTAVTQVSAQGTWSFTASMDETHHNLQTATRLKNGKVL